MSELNVLVVDDELAVRQELMSAISKAGYPVESVSTASEALAHLDSAHVDVVLSGVELPSTDGLGLLRGAHSRGHSASFIMVTAFGTVDAAIACIRAGAWDYVTKPVRNEEIVHRLAQIDALRSLREENRWLRSLVRGGPQALFAFQSPAMQAADRLIARAASTDSAVLIRGESGTGKSVAARRIHELSVRHDGPFVAFDCGSNAEHLIETELFGHTAGDSERGDRGARQGLFAQAEHGTLFLDRIGELPLALQSRLLNCIATGNPRDAELRRRLDVRIVTATRSDLSARLSAGTFLEELYVRLSAVEIVMPPLRECRADIPGLLRHLIAQHGVASGDTTVLTIDPAAEDLLLAFAWPGNVRQLENVVARALTLADGRCIRAADLPPELRPADVGAAPSEAESAAAVAPVAECGLRQRVRQFEVSLILRSIEEARGDRRVAAQRLCIGLSSLYRKLEEVSVETSETATRRGTVAAPLAPTRRPLP